MSSPKNGDVTSGTLRVKVMPGMKQKLFSFTQAMFCGWSMEGGQAKQGELFIALTHEDHKPIIFYRVLKAGNAVLLAAKMVINNPEEVNSAIVNGKQSKEYFHCWKPSSLLSNVHFRNTTKIAVQVLLLLTLFTFTFEPFLKL